MANVDSGSVTVLLGAGAGGFRARHDIATGPETNSVAAGDLNRDGRLDLVAASAASDAIVALLGHGDGTFAAPVPFPTGSYPTAVVLADVNADGRLDAAVTNYARNDTPGSVSVLLGNGDGTFSTRNDFVTAQGPVHLAAGDLNGDGRADLAVANPGDEDAQTRMVSVLLGNGDGTFRSRVDYRVGFAMCVAMGDLNADGRLDLATANLEGSISILMGRGDGTFAAGRDYWTLEEETSIALGDLDADGRLDLVVANWDSDTGSAYLGNGDGTFRARLDFGTGNGPGGIALGHLDADGRLDVAVANSSGGAVSVHLGRGDGGFGRETAFVTGRNPVAVAAGDLNADGRIDLVTSNNESGTVSVLVGRSGGGFGTRTDFVAGWTPAGLALQDLDADGWLDVVVANEFCDCVSVLMGRGDGTFGMRASFATGHQPRSVAIGDFDSDGVPDVAVANSYSYTDSAISLLFGRGDGTFDPRIDLPTAANPGDILTGDVNGDSRIDLLVSSPLGVSLYLGNGDGTFQARWDVATTPAGDLSLGDLNADSHPDLVVAGSDGVSVLLGTGGGSFTPRIGLSTSRPPTSVAIADLNADGALDLAVATWANTISVLTGAGDGTFVERTDYGTGPGPQDLVVADLNGDGRPDLAAACGSANSIFVLHNETPVSVLVEDLAATAAADGSVRLTWRLSAQALSGLLGVAVQRAESVDGPYAERTTVLVQPAAAMSFEDQVGEAGRDFWYRLVLVWKTGLRSVSGPVSIRVRADVVAAAILYPPFVPAGGAPVTIRYGIGARTEAVTLGIFDVRGRRIWNAAGCPAGPGEHGVAWNRSDERGIRVARGVYIVNLQAGSMTAARKFVLASP